MPVGVDIRGRFEDEYSTTRPERGLCCRYGQPVSPNALGQQLQYRTAPDVHRAVGKRDSDGTGERLPSCLRRAEGKFPRVKFGKDRITLYGWSGSVAQVLLEGAVVLSCAIPVPPVPKDCW